MPRFKLSQGKAERQGFLVEFTPESLKMVRKFRKLTQQGLAERVDSSGDYISELERGKSTPTVALMGRLGEALEVVFFK